MKSLFFSLVLLTMVLLHSCAPAFDVYYRELALESVKVIEKDRIVYSGRTSDTEFSDSILSVRFNNLQLKYRYYPTASGREMYKYFNIEYPLGDIGVFIANKTQGRLLVDKDGVLYTTSSGYSLWPRDSYSQTGQKSEQSGDVLWNFHARRPIGILPNSTSGILLDTSWWTLEAQDNQPLDGPISVSLPVSGGNISREYILIFSVGPAIKYSEGN